MAYDPRAHWGRLMAATALTLAAAFVLPRLVRPPDIQENRLLAEAPAPPRDWASLRAFPKAADAYVADRFPARPHLIGLLNILRLKLGVSGSDRVLVGRDGWLFSNDGSYLGAGRNDPPFTDDKAQAWLEGLAARTEALKARGVGYVVVIAPTKEMVYPQYGPWWYRGPAPDRAAAKLAHMAEASGAGELVYPYEAIKQQARWGLKTYSRHDTHWTGLGAYIAYAEIMKRLQARGLAEGPRPFTDFSEVMIGSPTKPRDLALMLGVASFVEVDFPEFSDPELDKRVDRVWLSDEREWTSPQVLETHQDGKPVLLLTRDSFATALIPFLQSHFSRIVVSHLEDGVWREDLMEKFKPDVVMLEVLESGLGSMMDQAPPPSPAARARIAAALAAGLPRPQEPGAPRKGLTLEGGPGPDLLAGGALADEIHGRTGDDRVGGGPGADVLRGGQGNDELDGGEGDDWMSGDRGDDLLRGGAGADVFHAFAGGGTDRVLDFSQDDGDRVVLAPGTAFTVRQEGADAVIVFEGGRLVLVGVDSTALRPGRISAG